MFGNLIYFDNDKINQYIAVINKSLLTEDQLQGDKSNQRIEYLSKCVSFENLLEGRDDYIDFVNGDNTEDIKEIKTSTIIKVRGEIYIPESFDMIHLIDEFKPLVLSSIEYKDEEEKQLFNTVFNGSKMKIPIFCELGEECDYWLGIGKAIKSNLMIEYSDFEDFEERPVNILAKLESRRYFKDSPLTVFDIYKDFFGLNRTLRKQIVKDKNSDFEEIKIEEDYLGLELLAIY
ncbi:MAG: hypothetical protein IJH71_00550 [Eubacterium sp.]|nr:hypothetical protein [Eubacterium sp.]